MPKSKSMCAGCRDDFYNRNREGGCWMFRTAKVVKRVQVGVWEKPPYDSDRKQKFLNCYYSQGYAILKLDDSRVKTSKAIAKERNEQEAE